MNTLRNRKGGNHASVTTPLLSNRYDPDEEECGEEEALLAKPRHATSSANNNNNYYHPHPHHSQPHPRNSSITSKAGKFFMGIFYSFINLLPSGLAPISDLSPAELARLRPFREYVSSRFDSDNHEHMCALRELWAHFCPSVTLGENHVTPKWKDFGFQGNDPATDFRGAGSFALTNLLYLANAYPQTFDRLSNRNGQTRDQVPFAIAGINVTMMLLNLLHLTAAKTALSTTHDTNTVSSKLARRSFCHMLMVADDSNQIEDMSRIFGEVYCVAFVHLEQLWRDDGANIMQFNSVLLKCKNKMDDVLKTSSSLDDVLATVELS
eukprot:Sspe_Gene.6202::Locus_2090_Transcript_1_1_Confidence_1.000_Length_1224::g.6202::m.6202